jgi:hypothetical protein
MLIPGQLKLNDKVLVLRNSSRSAFMTCARKYYYAWREKLVPKKGSTAMRAGSAWHAMLESFYQTAKEENFCQAHLKIANHIQAGLEVFEEETEKFDFIDDYRTMDNLIEMFSQYLTIYENESQWMEIEEAELQDNVEIELSQSDIENYPILKDWKIYLNFQVDLLYRANGGLWIMEHKTTGANITQIANALHRTNQVQTYFNCLNIKRPDLATQIQGAMVNIAQFSSRRKTNGEYGKLTVNFARSPETYTAGDRIEWRDGLLYSSSLIIQARMSGNYPVNLDRCYEYNSSCTYSELCDQSPETFQDLHTDNFQQQEQKQSYMIGANA